MKKYLSVFSVIARESIWRISLLWIASAALQTVSFYREMLSENVQSSKMVAKAFTSYEDNITVPVLFALTMLLTGILLMKTGMDFRTRTGYTLRRLRITEKQVYLLQSVYNSLMLFILFLFEVALCFVLVNWGTSFIEPEYVTNQTVYLTFYSSEFLSDMFAGRDIINILRNLLMIISLGFNLSCFAYMWRRGRKHILGALLLVIWSFMFWWCPGFGNFENAAISVASAGMLIAAAGIVRSGGKEYDS